MSEKPRHKRKIFTFKNKRHMPVWLARVLAGVLRVWSLTLRVTLEDPHGVLADNVLPPRIFALWHNRILLAAPQIPAALRPSLSVLISASRDGEYISAFVRCFQIGVVRGSSSRGGVSALLALRQVLQAGRSVLLTVDGPRGPRYCVHGGVPVLSRLTGGAVVPVCINYSHYVSLRSWDRMQIPWPFSRARIVLGRPLTALPAPTAVAAEVVRTALLAITEDRRGQEERCQKPG